jgi:uncharacterized membrane-anchored protein
MFKKIVATFFLFGSLIAISCAAENPQKLTAEEFVSSLNFQTGKINLPGSIATLDLPPSFRYVGPDDAEKILVNAWGNPPGNKTLGMIFPADVSPLQKNGWGVVVTYEKDGHVKDDDADSIKYDELLKTMQESEKTNNDQRKKNGYPEMNLVGWAEQPIYDKQSHKLYWAKDIHFNGAQENTLNYNVRVLGREGVLVLNAVAGMNQIADIKQQMQTVNQFSEFTPGNRYADFDNKTDKVAEYGIAALVAGGIAAKLGLFGKFIAILIAFKKLLFVAVAGAGSYVYKFFKRKKEDANTDSASSTSIEL